MRKLFIVFIGAIIISKSLYSQNRNQYYLFSDDILKQKNENEDKGTYFSFIGNYNKALFYFDKEEDCKRINSKISLKDSIDFKSYTPIDANKYIIERAKNEKIILINEAHNMPMNRAYTVTLLKELYNIGYRYFGAETFSNFVDTVIISQIGNKKYPIFKTGYYTVDPVFGDLVREAINIGFEIFSYEEKPNNNNSSYLKILPNGDTVRILDMNNPVVKNREIEQARNIQKILKKDPNAKIIVHAGYGHIVEGEGSVSMGQYFKEFSGINPLTIDQYRMSEMSSSDCENPYFKIANIKRTSVFIRKIDDSIFVEPAFKNRIDIQVFHPRAKYINGRPDWLYMNGRKKAFNIEKKYLRQMNYPVLVFAYYNDENIEEAIPIDVIEINNKKDIKALVLPKGTFKIIIQNKENKTISYIIKNEK